MWHTTLNKFYGERNKAGLGGYVSGEIALPPWNKVKKENVL